MILFSCIFTALSPEATAWTCRACFPDQCYVLSGASFHHSLFWYGFSCFPWFSWFSHWLFRFPLVSPLFLFISAPPPLSCIRVPSSECPRLFSRPLTSILWTRLNICSTSLDVHQYPAIVLLVIHVDVFCREKKAGEGRGGGKHKVAQAVVTR